MPNVRRPYMAKPPTKAASEPATAKGKELVAEIAEKVARKVSSKNAFSSENPVTKRGPGRPSIYTDELADDICARMSKGESLRAICSDPDMPDRQTIANWQNADAHFSARILRARELMAEAWIEEALQIADNPAGDYVEKADGSTQVNWENVQRSKLRCDTRLRIAAKLAPSKFGEKVTQEHVGPGGGAVLLDRPKTYPEVQTEISRLLRENEQRLGLPVVEEMPKDERLRRVIDAGPLDPQLYDYVHGYRGTVI